MANSEVRCFLYLYLYRKRISSISLLIAAATLFGIKCKNMRIMSLLQPVQHLRNLDIYILNYILNSKK